MVITGASSGLGAACALRLAGRGNRLALIARRKAKLKATARLVSRRGGTAIAIRADLTKAADVEMVARRVDRELGGCDLLINNAGSYMEGLPLIQSCLRDWQEMLNTNARAAFLLCRALVPGMVERRSGRIINVISASKTLIDVGLFRISKIALEVITAVLAAELQGTGVAATAVNPGFMRTEISSMGRNPVVVAQALALLLECPTGYLNGSVFDLYASGRGCRFRKRRAGHGRFGLLPGGGGAL